MNDTTWKQILSNLDREAVLSTDEAVWVYRNASLHELGRVADTIRRRWHPDERVSYVVDRNINYTNICTSRCRFCAFYRDPEDADAYVLSREEIFQKVEETEKLGGTGILMQGGLHPELTIDFYENLLRDIRKRFTVDLHCFSPPEIIHMARVSRISTRECLVRLQSAGLGSVPGGGAEILSDEVRRKISPAKCSSGQWMEVMEIAHSLGLKTTATMMFGCGETLRQRMDHLAQIRHLQERTGGFVSFIPWTFQGAHTDLGREGWTETSAVEYLRWLALSRIFLYNFPSIQSSWVTQGLKVAQVALFFGANDIGSVMIEENVVAATGVRNRTNEAELVRLIRDAGFEPVRRNNVHERLFPADFNCS